MINTRKQLGTLLEEFSSPLRTRRVKKEILLQQYRQVVIRVDLEILPVSYPQGGKRKGQEKLDFTIL
jgi:hypothetical protein